LCFTIFFLFTVDSKSSDLEYVIKSIVWDNELGIFKSRPIIYDDYSTPQPTVIAITFGNVDVEDRKVQLLPIDFGFTLKEILENPDINKKFYKKVYSESGLSEKKLSDSGFVLVAIGNEFELTRDYDGEITSYKVLGELDDDDQPIKLTAKFRGDSACNFDDKLFETGFTIYYARKYPGKLRDIVEYQYVEKKMGYDFVPIYQFDMNAKTYYDLFNAGNTSSNKWDDGSDKIPPENTKGGYYWTGGCPQGIAEGLSLLFTVDELKSINNSGIRHYGLLNWTKVAWRTSHMWSISVIPYLDNWPKLKLTEKGLSEFIQYYKDASEVFEGAAFKNHGDGLDSVLYLRLDSATNLNGLLAVKSKVNEMAQTAIKESKAISLLFMQGNKKIKTELASLNKKLNELNTLYDHLRRIERLKEDIKGIKSNSKWDIVSNQKSYTSLLNLIDILNSKVKSISDALQNDLALIRGNVGELYTKANELVVERNNNIMNSIRNSSPGTIYYMEPPQVDYEDIITGETGGVIGGSVELIKKGMYDSNNMRVVVNKLPEPDGGGTFKNATSKFKNGRIAASIGYGAFQFSTDEMTVPLKYIITPKMSSSPNTIEDLIDFFE
jgi:hypothetical protein